VAERPLLYRGCFCYRFATRGIEPLHRLLEPGDLRAQIRVGLTDVRVSKQVADFVKLEAALVPARPGFSAEVMKMQVDAPELPTARVRQSAAYPDRFDS